MLTAWGAKTDLSDFRLAQWPDALYASLHAAMQSPVSAFWGVAVFGCFLIFTDTHSNRYRIIGGTLHGLSHVFAVFLLGWGSNVLVSRWFPTNSGEPLYMFLVGFLIAIGGWVVGSCIMGGYLLISLNVFGRHSNESFSSLAIQDWKNFVRMKISADGTLTIYPVGIRRVPRRWKAGGLVSAMSPDDPRATVPTLIEEPIVVQGIK